ncbi:hypothetical protein ACVKU6_004127, partial [Stenotrophomonas sp. PvP086]
MQLLGLLPALLAASGGHAAYVPAKRWNGRHICRAAAACRHAPGRRRLQPARASTLPAPPLQGGVGRAGRPMRLALDLQARSAGTVGILAGAARLQTHLASAGGRRRWPAPVTRSGA